MTAVIVGPVPTVRFGGGPDRDLDRDRPKVAYAPPVNTMDPRYAACTKHHVACDCREAEFAEERQEVRLQVGEQQDVIAEVLAGHPIWAWSDNGHVFVGCRCTGCTIVRAAGLWPSYRGNPPEGEHR